MDIVFIMTALRQQLWWSRCVLDGNAGIPTSQLLKQHQCLEPFKFQGREN